MPQAAELDRISGPEDEQAVIQLMVEAYSMPPEHGDAYIARLGRDSFRLLRRGDEIVASLAIYMMGQWFGGRSLPMAGIAAVAVAPEHRGAGIAFTLMSRVLTELREAGCPISSLYPSTQRLYRKVGYEQAGHHEVLAIPARDLELQGRGPGDRELEMRQVDAAAHQVFHDLHREQARTSAGNLDRNTAIWERLVDPGRDSGPIHAYLVGPESRPEGYVVFLQPSSPVRNYDLSVRDLVALTPRAARRIVTFLGDHRSEAHEVSLRATTRDPFLCLLSEQTYRLKHVERWQLRLVHLPRALAGRGYPPGVEAELHLEVSDTILPANSGRFVLSVASGEGEVAPGGRGDLVLDVRGLAPLFSGLFTPRELARLGLLAGGDTALATAANLFAGPHPWMPDGF